MTHRFGTRPTRRIAAAATLGVALVGVAAVMGGGVRAATSEPARVTRRAYFTYPATQAAPPILLKGFPPSTACLVAGIAGIPQACGPEVTNVGNTLGLGDGLPVPVTPDGDVAQPVTPGTTPVGLSGGQQRWVSLFQLGLPSVPAGQELSSFELVLHQDGLNYAAESPAFREAVLAAVSQVEGRNPQLFVTLLQRLLDRSVPALTQSATGIEACPAVESWRSGDGQGAGLDGTRLPDVDCLLGTTGRYDPAARTFTFDLTYAAQAWTGATPDGTRLANEGIVLRAVGAPNVAYGDPDLSTNFLISLAHEGNPSAALRPIIRYSTAPAPESVVPDLPAGDAPPLAGDVTFVEGPTITPGSSSTRIVLPGGGSISARFGPRRPRHHGGSTSAWLLVLVPLGALGAYAFGESLLAPAATTAHRPGALTRLLERRYREDL